MKRINQIIELLEAGQPVYCDGGRELSYEGGVKSAQTHADWSSSVSNISPTTSPA